MKDKKSGVSFWKKNGYYVLIAISVAAIAVMSTFAVIKIVNKDPITIQNPDNGEKPDEKPVITEIVFDLPLKDCAILKNYVEDSICFNQTTKDFRSHFGIDFSGSAGASVYAVYDGVVESNITDTLDGTTLVIDHGNGLKTVYGSLLEKGNLQAGDSVKKGDVIGQISKSYSLEYSDGEHLHFEVIENGVKVNPEEYLVFEEK